MNDDVAQVVAAISAVVADVAGGNLRARAETPDDAPEALKALAAGINQLIVAWRTSEVQARKTKRELEDKIATIETQAVAIRELSTPVMQIWKDVLLLPIVGAVDEARSSDITMELLTHLEQTQATRVIIDVTGVELVDERTADHLVRLVRAAELLGARCVVTGVSPAVATTLVSLGADIGALRTLRTLERGLVECIS